MWITNINRALFNLLSAASLLIGAEIKKKSLFKALFIVAGSGFEPLTSGL